MSKARNDAGAWISVKDKLPEYDVNVLGFDGQCLGVYSLFYNGDGWLWACADGFMWDLVGSETQCDDEYILTHWMPLPEAPNAE